MKKVELTPNALTIAQKRYFMEGEDWGKCIDRVASVVSVCEDHRIRDRIKTDFYDMIYNQHFLPGGRILRNCGRPRGSLFNCYHLPIGDNIEQIGQLIKDSLILWSEGGGVGINFSPLRPRGDAILGKGGVSSGLVSFIEAADAVSHTIESGGARRAAAIAHVDISHPEVLDFIDAKLLHKKLSHFNISVAVNNEFLETVEANGNWTFKFKQKSYATVKARDIWNKIIKNMIQCAEPGLINWTNFYKNNSWYFAPICGTNPCHTGDTLVAVADGRRLVSFKQLAKEKKDIPVFCLNDKTQKIEVKMMRRPRRTGIKQKIFKVHLDNGMYFRSNDVHKITMFDGSKKQIKDLTVGDRLHHMVKYIAELGIVLGKKDTSKSDYSWMTNGYQKTVAEHRVIGQFKIGRELTKKEVVHHKDYDYLNNKMDNLVVMLKKDHDDLHRKDMMGDKNPMRRFPEKNYFKKHKFIGIENGNSKGYTIEELLVIATKYTKSLGRRPLITEWQKFCTINNYPFWAADIFKIYKGHKRFFDEICKNLEIPVMNQYLARSYKLFLEIKKSTDLDIFWDNGIKVNKVCERCGISFIVGWGSREQSFCSTQCKCEYASSCSAQKKIAATNGLNFKVIKIEEDGEEDVYNGTVDDYHNFYVFAGENTTKAGKPKSNFINSRNCGETVLEKYGVCCLGSLVLPNFIPEGGTNTNWKKLEQTIQLAVRFLDNIIEINKYTLKEIDISAHRSRRIGMGVLGVAEYLFAKKVRYGSEKAVIEVERLMKFIRDVGYRSSVDLAIEKGAFPSFEPLQYGKSSFIRKLPASLRMDIKKYGVRNCTLLALAPTGTISLLTQYSSGVEPLFAKAMLRKDKVGERVYIHPIYEKILEKDKEIPDWFVDSFDLQPKDHFETQVAAQKFCDGAVSKTINLPKGTTTEELSDLLLEYIYDLKGVTVYVDGSREGQILNKISTEEIKKYIKNKEVEREMNEADVQCATGSCEI